MRILVTGASGLLGLNLSLEASKHHQVFGTVNTHNLHTPAFSIIQTDLTAPGAVERILEQTQPDWVINCAALAIIDACEANPPLARQLNVELPEKLARIVARGGARQDTVRLLHLSTDAVFDGRRGDYTEEDAPHPLSEYARTKLEGELAVAAANPDAIIARTNIIGWGLSGKRSLSEFFFYNLQANRRVMGFTDVYFCPLLANDLAHLLLAMLEKGLSGLYHVVCREGVTKYDFGVALARRFNFDESLVDPTSVTRSGLKAARSPKLTLRPEKLARALSAPLPSWQEGLDRLFILYRKGYPQELKAMG
jgi:dTDP-4-dehydrorhamnose reductase